MNCGSFIVLVSAPGEGGDDPQASVHALVPSVLGPVATGGRGEKGTTTEGAEGPRELEADKEGLVDIDIDIIMIYILLDSSRSSSVEALRLTSF